MSRCSEQRQQPNSGRTNFNNFVSNNIIKSGSNGINNNDNINNYIVL